MRSYFTGWRRKVGSVTLALAMLLTGLWMRTRVVADVFVIYRGGHEHTFGSERNCVFWTSNNTDVYKRQIRNKTWYSAPESRLKQRFGETTLPEMLEKESQHYFLNGRPAPYCYVYYWWLVLPLTMVSAMLILWPSRKQISRPQPTATLQVQGPTTVSDS